MRSGFHKNECISPAVSMDSHGTDHMMRYDAIDTAVRASSGPYHQLVLVVGVPEKVSAQLRKYAQQAGVPYTPVGLTLGQRLLGLTQRQRKLEVSSQLDDLLGGQEKVVVLDHLALLFETSLQLNPMATLKHLARRRTVVAAWPGRMEGDHLVYAEPDHPEYRRCPAEDVLLVLV